MKKQTYYEDDKVVMGITLYDKNALEGNNMALHATNNPQNVIDNRYKFAKDMNIELKDIVFLNQTHSDHFIQANNDLKGKGIISLDDAIADCDAIYTTEKQLTIGIFTADCVPILLYDPTKKLIAAIHSGWMGTCKEILNKVLDHLINNEQINPQNLIAYIGKAIEKDHFEVGMDVVNKLHQISFDVSKYITMINKEKAFVDQKGINQQMLINHGVLNDNIHIDHDCTITNINDCFSYRRDHQCGRHFSYIMLK